MELCLFQRTGKGEGYSQETFGDGIKLFRQVELDAVALLQGAITDPVFFRETTKLQRMSCN